MQHGISTHVFLQQRLTPGLLDTLVRGGAGVIEVFAARHHFAYTDRDAVCELANWFRANGVDATMHMPLFAAEDETHWTRHTEPTLNLISEVKATRIAAMDEVKRALEAAEQVPFRSCVLHLGLKEDRWDTRALDDSLTSVEHLKAFAGPLGVKLLLENLTNEVATPAHLAEIVRVGHFESVGFCLDTGHAHLTEPSATFPAGEGQRLLDAYGPGALKDGLAEAFYVFGDKLAELHLHDNGGQRDEHCWPGEGDIEWPKIAKQIAALQQPVVGVLEIAHDFGEDEKQFVEKASASWKLFDSPSA